MFDWYPHHNSWHPAAGAKHSLELYDPTPHLRLNSKRIQILDFKIFILEF